MLKQQNDGSDRELGSKSSDKLWINGRRTDVPETTGDGRQNLDGCGLLVAAVQPGCDGKYDDSESTPQDRDEEEDTS